ncbi:MAG: TolC family protein [Byssovorax sp.]
MPVKLVPLLGCVGLSLSAALLSGRAARAEEPPSPGAIPGVIAPPADGAPTLAKVVALAREQAPNVALARAELGVGRAGYAGARLAPVTNPYVEMIAGRGSSGTKDVTLQGTLFFPIEVSGQRDLRIAENDALVAWQTANVGVSRADATGEAVRAFGAAAVSAGRVRTYDAIVAVARAEADLYAARREAGDATVQDATLARVELAKNVVMLEEARADLARALGLLNGITGARFTEAPGEDSLEPPAPRPAEPSADAAARSAPLVQAADQESVFHARSRDRQARDAHNPLSLIVTAGRGDLGEARIGGGLGWTFPVFRKNQGDVARADAERARAVTSREVRARVIAATLAGLRSEQQQVLRALGELRANAEPAALAAVEAALTMQRAGKVELLHVLTARRDLALLRIRRLDLVERAWSIAGEIAALTGEMP